MTEELAQKPPETEDRDQELTQDIESGQTDDSTSQDLDKDPDDVLGEHKADVDDENDDDDEQDDGPDTDDFDGMVQAGDAQASLQTVIEAILFASDEPLTAQRLIKIIEAGSVRYVKKCIKDLNTKYKENNSSFRIEKIAGGFQMMTLPMYNNWLKRMLKVRTDNKLTPAALEALAIVAYKQPIIRADIEAIRGVASGEVLRNLMYKGLVKMVGRAEVLGRPMLYGTTKKFLDTFGLHSLKDLPKVEELKKPQ